MNYIITKLPKSEIQVEITLSFEEFEPHVKRAAELISEEKDFEGFRRGKAPFDLVKSRVGEAAIYERAADVAVRKVYPNVMNEALAKGEISVEEPPIGRPEITVTKLAPGNEFVFRAKLALLPAITLPDYKKIASEKKKDQKDITVTDEEVDTALRWIRESRASTVTVDRGAEKGDHVEVDYEIRHGGVKVENGESKNHPFVLGDERFLPGFADNLVGLRAGEKKNFSLVVPEDWREKSFAGKRLDVSAGMKLVQERHVPELNDAFAKGLGNFSSVEELKQNIRNGLTQEKQEKEKGRVRIEIISSIAEQSTVEIPDVLIESELDKMVHELQDGVTRMGMKWDEYLLHVKKTVEELKKEWREEAEKRVRIALALREIARQEKIEPNEREIQERADQFLRQFKSAEDAQKNIHPDQLREYARGILRNEKVFEFLEGIV